MKPLILWARSKHPQPYTLRIGQRTSDTISGTVQIDGDWQPFSYDKHSQTITLNQGEDDRMIQINEWGWEQ